MTDGSKAVMNPCAAPESARSCDSCRKWCDSCAQIWTGRSQARNRESWGKCRPHKLILSLKLEVPHYEFDLPLHAIGRSTPGKAASPSQRTQRRVSVRAYSGRRSSPKGWIGIAVSDWFAGLPPMNCLTSLEKCKKI